MCVNLFCACLVYIFSLPDEIMNASVGWPITSASGRAPSRTPLAQSHPQQLYQWNPPAEVDMIAALKPEEITDDVIDIGTPHRRVLPLADARDGAASGARFAPHMQGDFVNPFKFRNFASSYVAKPTTEDSSRGDGTIRAL